MRFIQTKINIFLGLAFATSFCGSCLGSQADQNNTSIIDYTDAVIYGVVEGVTEFLPISSTGHLVLVEHLLSENRAGRPQKAEEAIFAYLIVIQGGAILAVAWLYRVQVSLIFLGLIGRSEKGRKLGVLILLSFLPAAALGPFLDDIIESVLLGLLPIALALIVGAFVMFRMENSLRRNCSAAVPLDQMTKKSAIVIGFLQCVAMWPGTSRSMMTIIGGYWVGLSRVQAAEYSFLLGLVTLTAAAGYKILFAGSEMITYLSLGPLLVGCLIAGVSAALSVKWLVSYLSRKGLSIFAWYRLVLGSIILAWYFSNQF